MAYITNPFLLSYKNSNKRSDPLDSLKDILYSLPDDDLIHALEVDSKHGRKDFPIRAVWNAFIAKAILGIKSYRALSRELKINPELMHICGFPTYDGGRKVPSPYVFIRFRKKLKKFLTLVREIFLYLVREYNIEMPVKEVALDSTDIKSGKKDNEAEWGVKNEYKVKRNKKKSKKQEKGEEVEVRVKRWYGYKLFLAVDARTGMPLHYRLYPANKAEAKGFGESLEGMSEEVSEVYEGVKSVIIDKGGDSTKIIKELIEEGKIGVIAKREDWKDISDETRVVRDNIVMDERGRLYCCNPGVDKDYDNERGVYEELVWNGMDRKRNRVCFKCPSGHYGRECPYADKCKFYGKNIWIRLDRDDKLLRAVPGLYRGSYKFKEIYARRTVVERVFGQLKWNLSWMRGYYVRGRENVEVETLLGLIILLQNGLNRLRMGYKGESIRRIFE